MTSYEEAAHSLQFENSQLRTELKAQQIVNMKLRKEKDDTLLALHDCKEENRYTYESPYQIFTVVSMNTHILYIGLILMSCK